VDTVVTYGLRKGGKDDEEEDWWGLSLKYGATPRDDDGEEARPRSRADNPSTKNASSTAHQHK